VKAEQAAQLRAPFPPEQIGKLPRGGVALDFVGHAATTDRLLQVDPDWTWTPVAHDELGLPRRDEHGGLWINLTVLGVTRLGYGDAGTKTGPNAVKEAIGDAIRNAAMRFGVALDLWTKEDLQHGEVSESPRSVSPRPARAAKASSSAAAPPTGDTGSRPVPSASASTRAAGTQGDAGGSAPGGDEHERMHAQPATSDLKLPPEAKGVISAAQVKKMWTMARGYGLGDEQVKEIVVNVGGVDSSKLIPRAKFEAVLKEIELTGRGVQA
jgi:hypothetical protein